MAIRDLIPWRRPSHELERPYSWDPFSRFHEEMNRLFDDFFRGGLPMRPEWGREAMAFDPRVNVYETEKEFRVSAELPGLEQKDIEVEVTEGGLALRGEKKMEHEEKKDGYRTIERSYGSFHRQVPLPADVDASKAGAEFKNGVLTVTVPKLPEAASKRTKIEVKAS